MWTVNDNYFEKPGVVAVRRADWDGWPIGIILYYVGPIGYEDYLHAEKRSDRHYSWEPLVAPEDWDTRL